MTKTASYSQKMFEQKSHGKDHGFEKIVVGVNMSYLFEAIPILFKILENGI